MQIFYEIDFEIFESRYPTRCPAAGNEGMLDAAPCIPFFFLHTGSIGRQRIFLQYGTIHKLGMVPKLCFLRNSSHNPNYFWEEIFKGAPKFAAYVLGHKRWLRLKNNFVIKCNIFCLYITVYRYSDSYLYIHSDHIMATCFDSKTVIIRPIKNIFKCINGIYYII